MADRQKERDARNSWTLISQADTHDQPRAMHDEQKRCGRSGRSLRSCGYDASIDGELESCYSAAPTWIWFEVIHRLGLVKLGRILLNWVVLGWAEIM